MSGYSRLRDDLARFRLAAHIPGRLAAELRL